MKKAYENVVIDVVLFHKTDCIVASGEDVAPTENYSRENDEMEIL